MHALPTALLLHVTRRGRHFDWLLGDPRDVGGRLLTFRVAWPFDAWASMRSWNLEPLAPHRRAYLAYEGGISDGRGQVRRIDEGVFVPVLWTPSRTIIELRTRRFTGSIELRRVSDRLWRGRMISPVVDAADLGG